MARRLTSDSMHSALSTASTLLSVGAAATPFAPQMVAAAVRILEAIEKTHSNRMELRELGEDIGRLVCAVWHHVNEGYSEALQYTLSDFLLLLSEIEGFLSIHRQRGRLVRFLTVAHDAGLVQEYRRRVRNALDVFDVSSQLLLHQSLGTILSELQHLKKVQSRPAAQIPASGWGNMYNNHVSDSGRLYHVPIGGGINSNLHFGDSIVHA
ncbi:hypothetical protein MKEN_00204700 [Mycena kentingensis (nom. inval.)]|nr:hypothetical protein MKEN_00204700 [Mycena kentingensis (nom. inval.)]